MSSERANPFAGIEDFEPQSKSRPVDPAALQKLSEETGFPSRKPTMPAPPKVSVEAGNRRRRRYTTGRNQQINIKATDATIERLYRIADDRTEAEKRTVPLGEVLELALDALEREQKGQG